MEDKVWVLQSNGSYYCYLRKRVWENGNAKVIEKKLLGKSDVKGGELKPTRKKRPAGTGNALIANNTPVSSLSETESMCATRMHTGMMDIIDFIGRISGIDEDLYAVTDKPTADKIISLARYIVATDGATFPGIEEWMLTHPVPYVYPITEDVYLNLFHDVGLDETLRQSYFKCRFEREPDLMLIVAYDSSTENSVSKNPEARVGMNKDHNGKTAVKILVLYSLRTRRPLAFIKQPANVPDIISIEDALNQFKALGIKNVAVVTDGGFSSDDNLGEILHSKNHSLTRVKINWNWVKKEIDAHTEELRSASSIMPTDLNVKGVTVSLTRTFSYVRTYGSTKKSLAAGDRDTFRKRVYLHLYYDTSRKETEDRELMSDLLDIKELIEKQEPLSESAQKLKDQFLDVRERAGKITVTLRNKEIDDACRYNGVFALISTYFKDPNESLEIYRKREWIEDYFERFKQNADGDTSRTGNPDKLNGRMFMQFIAMSYVEELHERLRQLKASLGIKNGDPSHDTKANLDAEKALKYWLKHRSAYRTMKWFDAHETVNVSSEIRKVRWNTDTIARDKLFLNLLGVTDPKQAQ